MESDDKKLYTLKYVQIEDHIISEIRNGRLKTGDRSHRKRSLSGCLGEPDHGHDRDQRAYRPGILVRRQGKGTFARRDDPEISEETDGFSAAQAGSAASASRTIAFGGGIRLASPEKAGTETAYRSWRTGSSLRILFSAESSVLTREAMSTRSSAVSRMAGRLRRWILLISRCLYAADTPSTVRNYRPA